MSANVPALRQLARDMAEHFGCDCYDRDGNPEPPRCRCRGEGTDMDGNIPGPLQGCFHCQAKYALRHPRRRPSNTTRPRGA